ncbi:MAG: hypothetical protein AAB840_01895 [Patescibacteria group bacterium]
MKKKKSGSRVIKVVSPILFVIGIIVIFISSAGWGAGFLGWHVILAGILVAPLGYSLGKVI